MESNKWIEIDKQRPELGKGVLVCLNNGFITVAYLVKTDLGYNWQLFGDLETLLVDKKDKVTHWMLLPEPPNKNDEDIRQKADKWWRQLSPEVQVEYATKKCLEKGSVFIYSPFGNWKLTLSEVVEIYLSRLEDNKL